MKRPYCGDQDSKVIDSRHSEVRRQHPQKARMPGLSEALHDL